MDSLQNLLGNYKPPEPSEALAIKQYIHEEFHADATIGITAKLIVVTVSSGALANTLRFRMAKLQAAANTTKPIIFRIG